MPDDSRTRLDVADLPTAWSESALGSVADVRYSSVDKHTRAGEEPVRLCNYTDVYKNDYITGDLEFMQASATRQEIDRFGICVGDVMLTKDSETPYDIGVPAVADDAAHDLVCGYHLGLIRPDPKRVDPTFLCKQLGQDRISRYFAAQANGLTRYGLPLAAVTNTPIWLPPLGEQAAIAGTLRLIDDAIARGNAVIAKLKHLRSGLLHDLLTYGIDENGELRDPSRQPGGFTQALVGNRPVSWESRSLSSLAPKQRPYLRTGPFGSSLKQQHWTSEGVPVVTIGAIGQEEFVCSELLFVSLETAAALQAYTLLPGDIVFSRVADVGRCTVVTEAESGWIMSSNLMCVSLDLEQVNPRYAQFQFSYGRSIRRQVSSLVNSAGREVANAATLNAINLPLPLRAEQDEIVARIETLDETIKYERRRREKLSAVKHGLSHELLTGRVRVPDTPQEQNL